MEEGGLPLVGRREVLRGGAVLFATIAVSGCASLFAKKRDPDLAVVAEGGDVRVPATEAPWTRGGGQGTLVVAVVGRDDKLLLFRNPEGYVVASDMTCTHRGCDVDWNAAKGRLVCPCHGSEYSPRGAVLRGPAPRALKTYAVSVDEKWIVVHLA